jgi:hypothetical protein
MESPFAALHQYKETLFEEEPFYAPAPSPD